MKFPWCIALGLLAALGPLACQSTPAPTDAQATARAETIARINPGRVRAGDSLPDLAFESLDGAPAALSSLRGRPTVLVFGSCTCEPFVRSMAAISELEREFRGRVAFLLVYIDEAHPTDGWVTPDNPFEVARDRSQTAVQRRPSSAAASASRSRSRSSRWSARPSRPSARSRTAW